jgi:protein O-mannosyl-transferase
MRSMEWALHLCFVLDKLCLAQVAQCAESEKGEEKMEKGLKVKFWQLLLPPSLLSLLTYVFYYPSLKYPFQFDDLANITKKFDIRSFNIRDELFRTPRWLGETLNKINFKFGQFDPWYYRSVNLLIHMLSGLLLYFLVYIICSRQKTNKLLSKYALWISSITSMFFLLHPVQTQAVSYVIQARLEGLATLFVLLTILPLAMAFNKEWRKYKITLTLLGFAAAFISCGTKEIVIVAPVLLALIDWFFIAEFNFEKFKSRWFYYFVLTGIIFSTLLYYLKPKFLLDVIGLKMATVNNRGNILTSTPIESIKPLHFLISEFKVILHNLQLFLFPVGMSVEYDWKLSESFFAPDSFFPFLALVGMVYSAVYWAVKKNDRVFSFGLFWFLVSVAPRSSIIPSPELICDYKTYLSSIGVFFAMAVGIVWLAEKLCEHKKLGDFEIATAGYKFEVAFVAIFSLFLGSGLYSRNKVWSSSIAFWEDIVTKAPKKARGHNNLGVALSEEGGFERAIPHYLQAIQLDKVYSDPWSNLAVAYSVKGKDDEAISALKEAIRIFPSYPEAYNNLGTLILKKKEYEKAEETLKLAISLRPHYGKAHFNLGRVYLEQKENEKAWNEFVLATKGDLDTSEGFFALGQIGIQLKRYDEAINAFKNAAQRGNMTPQLEFCLANAYYLAGSLDDAEGIYRSLNRRFPKDGRFIYNLAETLYTKNEFEKAVPHFKAAGKLGSEFPTAFTRIANCVERIEGKEQAIEKLEEFMAENLGEKAHEGLKKELGRIRLQAKIDSGNGELRMKDFQEIFGKESVNVAQGGEPTSKIDEQIKPEQISPEQISPEQITSEQIASGQSRRVRIPAGSVLRGA